MDKTLNTILKIILVAVLGCLVSCGDDKPPAPQPQVISKKINNVKPIEKTVPNTVPNGATGDMKPPPAVPEKATGTDDVKPPADKEPSEEQPADKKPLPVAVTPVTSELIKASLEMTSTYSAEGRIDPFAALFSDEPTVQVARTNTRKRTRRTPQTPLEKVAISQLKLTAIMRTPQGNRALVEDASGKGFVVQKGTYMGLNAGQVIRIDKGRVLIEEEIQNMVGEYIINNTELKLQKTAGEQ